jgi:hypothetical protein
MRWLRLLQVRKNQLRRLPEWIAELTELRTLFAWGNPLEAFPASIAQLPSLRRLSIIDCPVHVVTESELVPVVVRACRFDKLELGKIQAIMPGGKPIKQHTDRDRAWVEVTKQIDRVIARLKK